MRKGELVGRLAPWFALLWVLLVLPAAAQTPLKLPDYSGEITDIIRRGRELEIDRRWGEAVSHYESGLRRFPADPDLQRRFDFARLHYDLVRRYSDRSFCDTVVRSPLEEVLDLYDEVLLKIHTHYVEAPEWGVLVDRGTDSLEAALSEPAFIERNLPSVPPQVVDEFRSALRRLMATQVVRTRSDARAAAATAAQFARQKLGMAPAAAVLEYTCGAAGSLDVYSTYLTPDQLNEIYAQIEGNFVGLGIELKLESGSLEIVRVIPNSPAERSGIRAGDRIVAIDGRPTSNLGLDEAANMLQGEEGTMVDVRLATRGEAPRTVRVRREHVEVPSIEKATLIDPDYGVAYIKLTCFQKTTCRDLDAALWRLYRSGMKSLILDLRENPGGPLTTAVQVVDKFVEQGTIVSTRGRNNPENYNYTARAPGTWRVPLVVLIDGDSASAAEIFAGAVRDHGRATVVGQRSYGKGSIQGIFRLDHCESGIRLTTARFYSPSGRPCSEIGVEPEIVVRSAARPVDGSPPAQRDAILEAGLRVAREQVAQR